MTTRTRSGCCITSKVHPEAAFADMTGHVVATEPRETGFLFPPTALEAGIQLARLLTQRDDGAAWAWP